MILGYENLNGYLNGTKCFGSTIGRYANRIGGGEFILDGKEYQLPLNDGKNCLHGGEGFHKKFWGDAFVEVGDKVILLLSYDSDDGDNGFPGDLSVKVEFSLDNNNSFGIKYYAISDQKTIVNFTNHCYFNLKNGGETEILDHNLQIFADTITPVNENLVPTGEFMNVENTPFDFRNSKRIGDDIDIKDKQLILAGGYDHNFVLSDERAGLKKAARLDEPGTGRAMEVFTTEPGMQLYTGNFLDGKKVAGSEREYQRRSGLCLETQHFPDSPNHEHFPSVVLNADEQFFSETVYRFYF